MWEEGSAEGADACNRTTRARARRCVSAVRRLRDRTADGSERAGGSDEHQRLSESEDGLEFGHGDEEEERDVEIVYEPSRAEGRAHKAPESAVSQIAEGIAERLVTD